MSINCGIDYAPIIIRLYILCLLNQKAKYPALYGIKNKFLDHKPLWSEKRYYDTP